MNTLLDFAEQWAEHKPGTPWPLAYARDREHFFLPDSQAINAAIESFPLTLPVWDDLQETPPLTLVHVGNAILRWKALNL